tara:strand:- start:3480 stop:4415 length:936 start_codon:yes stop_codon:yes gene_type:complete
MVTVFLRFGVSAGVLIVLAFVVDLNDVWFRLLDMQCDWVLLAVLVSVLQVVGSAWRWRYTASQLGIGLSLRQAVQEYYLATFLNQILPGGVMGDVSRAWRHSRILLSSGFGKTGKAVRAVILERLSGQMVMCLMAVISLMFLSINFDLIPLFWVFGSVALGVLTIGLCVSWIGRQDESFAALVLRDTRTALFSSRAFPVQLLSSSLIVLSYLVMYIVVARAVGISTPTVELAPLIAPVLIAMLLPVTVAGWGFREAAAAFIWGSVGLTVSDGVVVSIGYGVVVLLSSLPGVVFLFFGNPDQRGRHHLTQNV